MTHLYDATKSSKYLRNAIKLMEKEIAQDKYEEIPHRKAELYWSLSAAHDTLHEYSLASENFLNSSNQYILAAEKTENLREYYSEYAAYMKAWSELEKAKKMHFEKNYSQANNHFTAVAQIFENTSKWNYLTQNYQAWAELETAEAKSQEELTDEAITHFQSAKDLFSESYNKLKERINDIQNIEEKDKDIMERIKNTLEDDVEDEIKSSSTKENEERKQLYSLIDDTEVRINYCIGRKILEEALKLNKQGEKIQSSQKYGSAAKLFEKMIENNKDSSEEIQPFVCLSQAWENMTQAEAESSPEKYQDAAKLFDQVKMQCKDQKSTRLIQGHIYFCKALEAGTKYEETRDNQQFTQTIQNLTQASNQYMRAGFRRASEYSKGTQRLFEAYHYMDQAGLEMDPAQKNKLYTMVERLLAYSLTSFTASGHSHKIDELQRILEGVKLEREMALSLNDILNTSSFVSPTEVYQVPMPTAETPVGVEQFETAEIHVSLSLNYKEFQVGDRVKLDMDIYNTGKGVAKLVKIENIIPKGLRLESTSVSSRVEDQDLNMKNRPLLPNTSEEILMQFSTVEKGNFEFEPRVIFIDESDGLLTHTVEKTVISVTEMGIADWLRGPRNRR